MIELDKAETGLGYMVQAYRIGGPFMHWITIFGLIALGITAWKVFEIVTKKQVNTKLVGLIKMSASLALATGLLSQVVGIVQALEAIKAAADVSPEIVMGGAIVSFYAPIWGLIVFIFALLLYYIVKEVIKAKWPENN
ncbi:MotA/TolQ/ExbB proton channel family protein [Draconibacterium sp. IB214405]|uniref:MotA/TolQ/ExbB proton channel family protein n=1 Tax=Draconibacterium sp. IB214405 TaxID=3097352 RepID=UPI002A1351ED|nr:MotA/TolQ/ExbB proton channel family protein [Draconibacterium sp. IB214405]MDX8338516.1 MotA/TolQ/ExbB proton channel family protein [Draconibacterium sp. IB214405]